MYHCSKFGAGEAIAIVLYTVKSQIIWPTFIEDFLPFRLKFNRGTNYLRKRNQLGGMNVVQLLSNSGVNSRGQIKLVEEVTK